MIGYLGFGRVDWCPNCGAATANADDEGVRICLACSETHRRTPRGRLIPDDETGHDERASGEESA